MLDIRYCRLWNAVMPLLFKLPRFRQEFAERTTREMLKPYQKVLQA
jgi:hypothetical protein